MNTHTNSPEGGNPQNNDRRANEPTELSRVLSIAKQDINRIFVMVKNFVVTPKEAWPGVKAQHVTLDDVYLKFYLPLLLLSAFCGFIGLLSIGTALPVLALHTVLHVMLASLFPYFGGMALHQLSLKFNGKSTKLDGIKLIAFSMLPAFVAQILTIIPYLGVPAILLSLYCFYIYLLGIEPMLSIPRNRRTGFFFVSFILLGLAFGVVAFILSSALPELFPNTLPQQLQGIDAFETLLEEVERGSRR